ncbi:MAG: hypothetical protein NVSMB63_11030 [Sediminibacterium sp.]
MVIPGYTGYAVPVENDSSPLFSEKEGLSNWTNLQQHITYYFRVRRPGKLKISLDANNKEAGSKILVRVAGKVFTVAIPADTAFTRVPVGTVILPDSGFYHIELIAEKRAGNTIAAIRSIQLAGTAAGQLHTNEKTRRNAASVHLNFPIEDSLKAVCFYNEVTVPAGADPVHSYFMAGGFARGYLGIQVNSETERRVIFSVWDAGSEGMDRNKVADTDKVKLLAKGEEVVTGDFGNEGTGGHSHWVYNWKAGETYGFLVTALPDSATKSTIYTGYIFFPDVKKWKLLAAFKAPKDGRYLRQLYSFNENFSGENGQLQRKAFFGNQWIQRENGDWVEVTRSWFSMDATGRYGDRLDFGAGVEGNRFYLWNGGFQTPTARYAQQYTRTATLQKPAPDWAMNADSAKQAARDHQLILDSIRSQNTDTTGSRQGVYYQLLREGQGDHVSLNDSVTVFYKGWLLKDGTVFDQTKDKPATFSLKRLIKGWQTGLPLCKPGGKIRLIIPSAQAYGIRTRSKNIPPNSVLVFDIDVVGIRK